MRISVAAAQAQFASSDTVAAPQTLEQTKPDLRWAWPDRSAAKAAEAEATALREKQAAAVTAAKAEYDDTASAIAQAEAALEESSFSQTRAAQVLRQLALARRDIPDADSQELMSSLCGSWRSGNSLRGGGAEANLSDNAATAGFAQMGVGLDAVLILRPEARGVAPPSGKPGLEILMLARTAKRMTGKETFDEDVTMADNMAEVLKQRQKHDDYRKAYGAMLLDLHDDDQKKGLERTLADEEKANVTAKGGMEKLASRLPASMEAVSKQEQTDYDGRHECRSAARSRR